MRVIARALAVSACVLGAVLQQGGVARGAPPPAHAWDEAELWFAPNLGSADLVRLFTSPEEWADGLAALDVFHFYARTLTARPGDCVECGPNTLDALARAGAFRRLEEWDVAIAIDAPAVKEWSCAPTRALALTRQAIAAVRRHGGDVRYVAMDEPLLGGDAGCGLTLDETAIHVARYAAALRARHPDLALGDVEPFPRYDAETLVRWLDALLARGFRPAFFQVDVDRVHARQARVDVAAGLRRLQAACAERGIRFGVILWGHPLQRLDDRAYARDVRAWMAIARQAAPAPDQLVVQSWAEAPDGTHAVPSNLPEHAPHSHTRLLAEAAAASPQ